ncbi:MAG: hypothetical protein GTO55_01280 [Armatimonadetes bacterium]|nr:hypothetical protein [Armatimonadota bacterium]NIM22909.1 hypothetical protein [Armatimonadota bacterium]NIM66781.1 hypothetical protein [Armatimonadota bacterium]NIM75323.1 hypothetical protein [Armatimonadota bacterium]NIN04969.1 hypothetical protein [Armatimonadota bacterium]
MDVTFAELAKVSGRSPAWLCEAERGFKFITRGEVRRLRQVIEEIAMSKGREM